MQGASFNISCSCNCYIKRKDTRFWRWDRKRLTAVLGSEDKWDVQPCQIPTCKNKQTNKKPYCTKTSSSCILQIPYQNAWWNFFFPPYWKVRGSQYLCSCLEYNLIVKLYGNSLLWGDTGHNVWGKGRTEERKYLPNSMSLWKVVSLSPQRKGMARVSSEELKENSLG